MIITISGKPGSGKSTVAKILAKKLGYKRIATGDLRGQLAQERGMTIDELNELGKTEDWTDKEVDKRTEEIGKTEDNIVFDSWLAWNFIPKAIKIFLDIDLKVAAERIFKDQRPDEAHQDTVEAVYDMIKKRMIDTNERYKKYYNADFLDLKNYDLVIDTTNLTVEQIVEKVMAFIQK